MKIWQGYGSEHSMNLVMIGHFKSADDAEETKQLIDKLTQELGKTGTIGSELTRFDEEVMNILRDAKCYILSPGELEHFLYDIHTEVDGDKIILTTDETEVSAFFKLMMNNGAKIEIYSAHEYDNTGHGR